LWTCGPRMARQIMRKERAGVLLMNQQINH
jgi:hypothetical protein